MKSVSSKAYKRNRIEELKLQHPYTIESIKNLIELYEAWGRLEKAKECRAKLREQKL